MLGLLSDLRTCSRAAFVSDMAWSESRDGGRVVAIVRGSSDEKAAERLRAGFDSGDATLLQRYDTLSKHLTVYAGVPSLTISLNSSLLQ